MNDIMKIEKLSKIIALYDIKSDLRKLNLLSKPIEDLINTRINAIDKELK